MLHIPFFERLGLVNGSAVSEASRREDPEEPGEVDRRIAFDTAV